MTIFRRAVVSLVSLWELELEVSITPPPPTVEVAPFSLFSRLGS